MRLIIIAYLFSYSRLIECVPFPDHELSSTIVSAKEIMLQRILSKLPEQTEDHKVVGKFDDEEVLTYRLPNDSIPLRYDIWLKTDIDKAVFEYTGIVKIHVKVVEPTDIITLHYRQITIQSINLLSTEGTSTQSNLQFKYIEAYEFLKISLPTLANPDEEFVLELQYSGTLREDRLGFYRSRYIRQSNNETVWLATTQFSMTEARHAVPSYDEPGIRAVMSMEIQHDKSYFALSNTPVVSREPLSSTNYVTTKFQDTPKMQTYILGFVICDYDYISNNDINMEHRVYAKRQAVVEGKVNLVLEVAEPILKKLEEHFNMTYPLTKMDHVAIPDFAFSAMENNGLITYREQVMFFDPETSTDDFKKTLIELISHETTHMWFGNIVSPKWWSYTWLKEGFASLFQFYIPHILWPEEDHLERFRSKTMQSAFTVDVEDFNSKPLNYYVESPTNIRNKFDTISYRKGASFLRMIQDAITEKTFIKGLQYFLKKMENKAAVPDDVHESLQKAYDEDYPNDPLDLTQIMSTWEEQAGFPEVHVEWNEDKIKLSQRRFGGGDEIYAIPITFATESSPDFNEKTPAMWMTTRAVEISGISRNDWIILNIQQSGYWQVTYSQEIWEKIMEGLKSDSVVVNQFNRAELFTVMRQAVLNGTLSDNAFYGLELLSYLTKETNNFVWQRVLEVDSIYTRFLTGTTVYPNYQELIESITKPQLDRLGMNDVTGESLKDADLRKSLMELSYRNFLPDCLNHELNKLKKFFESGEGSYKLCEGIRLADDDLHTYFVNAALSADSENRQTQLADLVCSLDKKILEGYLRKILESFERIEEFDLFFVLYEAMDSSAVSLDVAFDFILEHFEAIDEKIPNLLPIILLLGAGNCNNNELLMKLMQIIEIAKSGGILADDIVLALETTAGINMMWLAVNLQGIKTWFVDEMGPSTEGPTTTLGAAQFITSLIVIVFSAMMNIML